MPSGSSIPKTYFFHGHRRPTQNRPTVRGGFFTNRQILTLKRFSRTWKPKPQASDSRAFDIEKWDPDAQASTFNSANSLNPRQSLAVSRRLSPIARFVIDAFRKNRDRWGPEAVVELRKLRRVTPDVVEEVLKVDINPRLASKFFHWAGKQKGFKHNFGSYNALAYCLNRNGLYRSADQVVDLMSSQGKTPSEKQFEILIRMHSDANRGLRIFYIYQKMKQYEIAPRVFLYNRIMDGLVKTGHLNLALSVYEDFKTDGLVEERVTFMILIKGLCKAGRIDLMADLLKRMRENLCNPDVFAYTSMVKLLVGEGNLDGCLRVWEEMKRDKVEVDVMAYGTLVSGLCKGGMVEKGYELFKEMKQKGVLIDRAIYGVLINGFVDNGSVGFACDLSKDMVISGYRIDIEICNSLVAGLCNIKLVDKAYKFFQVAAQEGLEPDINTLNPLLLAYVEMKRFDDFYRLLLQMEKMKFSVKNDLSKFFSFMVEKKERTLMAMETFSSLKARGYFSTSLYNILMDSLLDIGEVDKALSLFDEMKEMKLELDPTSYSLGIICFVEGGKIQEACSCHNEIIQMSSLPSVSAYSHLAKGLCLIGEIDAAMMLVRECLANITSAPLEFKYTLTIIHACESNDSLKVIEVLNELILESCPPNEVVCSAVISGMCKHGTIEEARKVFANLQERRLLSESKTILYDEILIDHAKRKTADLVLVSLKFFGLESKLKARGSPLFSI